MALRYGFTFLQDNIWYHMLLRSVSALEGHTEPWWFYLSVLRSRAIFPSIELLGLSFVFFITRKNIFRDYRIAMPIILVLSITGVVSLMQTKLAWYVLPIYPYAALMIGHTFSSGLRYTLAYTHKQWNP